MEYQRFCGIIFGSSTCSPHSSSVCQKYQLHSESLPSFAIVAEKEANQRQRKKVEEDSIPSSSGFFRLPSAVPYNRQHSVLFFVCVQSYIIEFKSYLGYLFSLPTRLYIVNTGRNEYGCSLARMLQYININCTPIPPKHIYVANLKTFYTAAYC